ncbi:MAG TPA: rhodanese-like domain-containing protein [Isosphaeraceae bacterium]|jgi:rhodanese-related sulfurtransferase|nr:rhodanese-like domain-containing protein [Isosphaeraceae bacterium]
MTEPAVIAQVSPTELQRRLEGGERLVVLDVREPDERDYCLIRLPASATDLHIPMGDVQGQLQVIQAAASGSVVVYCHLGMRSMVVARWLAARGVQGVQNLEGGIDAWSAQVDPEVARY